MNPYCFSYISITPLNKGFDLLNKAAKTLPLLSFIMTSLIKNVND